MVEGALGLGKLVSGLRMRICRGIFSLVAKLFASSGTAYDDHKSEPMRWPGEGALTRIENRIAGERFDPSQNASLSAACGSQGH